MVAADIGIQINLIESIGLGGVQLSDMTVSKVISGNRSVLRFNEGVIIYAPSARLGEFNH